MIKTFRSAALVAALVLLALPAQAASYTGYGALTASSDDVNTTVNGAYHATAVITLSGTFTATVTFEQTLDGTNWLPSAYAVRTDQTSSNPTVGGTTTTTGTYEIPLPANATGVRARVSAYTSGTINAQARPGRPYQPGVAVTATLYDTTVAFAVGATSPTFDLTGWSSALAILDNRDTGGTSRNFVFIPAWNDGAAAANSSPSVSVSSGATGYITIGQGIVSNSIGVLPPRASVFAQAGTGTAGTARVVLYARR